MLWMRDFRKMSPLPQFTINIPRYDLAVNGETSAERVDGPTGVPSYVPQRLTPLVWRPVAMGRDGELPRATLYNPPTGGIFSWRAEGKP